MFNFYDKININRLYERLTMDNDNIANDGLSNSDMAAILIACFLFFCLFMSLITCILTSINSVMRIFESSNSSQSVVGVKKLNMLRIQIPFSFRLREGNQNYADFQCLISSQTSYSVYSFWGVSIKALHHHLWDPWPDFESALRDGTYMKDYICYKGLSYSLDRHDEKVIKVKLEDTSYLNLGHPPRLHYPLVIIMIRNNSKNIDPDHTVALISVIHIKDNLCSNSTSILKQFIKQKNGDIAKLKPLYLASGNSSGYNCNVGNVSEFHLDDLCAVCQQYPLSRALLPCRHTCVCAYCFEKLSSCPMCRSPIKSFFCIRQEEYYKVPEAEENEPVSSYQLLAQWLQNAITVLLGFYS